MVVHRVYAASRCPTSMIFIRCKGGISHNPAEYSSPEDMWVPLTRLDSDSLADQLCSTAGANVLLGAVLRYDRSLKSANE